MSENEKDRELSLEDAIKEIEDLVGRMENEELSLEEAFVLYQSGVEKIRFAEEAIGRVESRMKVLMEDGTWGDVE